MTRARLFTAAMYGLMPHYKHPSLVGLNPHSLGTVATKPRYKHTSELDAEKKAARRREIAKWNKRVDERKKK